MNDAKLMSIVLLEFEPAWLALSRDERRAHAARATEIAGRHADVELRWFDADALGNGYTDFAVCEFVSLMAYHALWEELRDLPLFGTPYVRIKGTHLGIERGYERYEAATGR
jgi:hypothetical protein